MRSPTTKVRAQYPDETKALVKAKYPLCRTPEDRDRLVAEAGICSRQKLYNLASRLMATRPHAGDETDWASEEGGYQPSEDASRCYLRDDFSKRDQMWSDDDRRYLTEHFGRTKIEEIAFFLNRTETAVAYEARRMGLRNVPKYYDARRVAPWLGITMTDLLKLSKHGLEVFPCTDRRGEVKITLVSTTSLARTLLRGRLWKRLIEKYDADEFFLRDLGQSMVALQNGTAVWEPNAWVSHGHTCLNPFSDTCFGWFYNGYDEKMIGEDIEPRDLSPEANVTSDQWRRGSHRAGEFRDQLAQLTDSSTRRNG